VRVVKRMEAYFRENAGLPGFNHYTPADWLLRNTLLIESEPTLSNALDRFEAFFKKVNSFMSA
jgi:hypothetical protein